MTGLSHEYFKKCKKGWNSNKNLKFMNSSLADEIDFVSIIDSIRQLKAHLKLQYDENQRSLLAFDKLYFIQPQYHEWSQISLLHRMKHQISNKHDTENLRVIQRYSVSNPSELDNQIYSEIIPNPRPQSLRSMIESHNNNDND